MNRLRAGVASIAPLTAQKASQRHSGIYTRQALHLHAREKPPQEALQMLSIARRPFSTTHHKHRKSKTSTEKLKKQTSGGASNDVQINALPPKIIPKASATIAPVVKPKSATLAVETQKLSWPQGHDIITIKIETEGERHPRVVELSGRMELDEVIAELKKALDAKEISLIINKTPLEWLRNPKRGQARVRPQETQKKESSSSEGAPEEEDDGIPRVMADLSGKTLTLVIDGNALHVNKGDKISLWGTSAKSSLLMSYIYLGSGAAIAGSGLIWWMTG